MERGRGETDVSGASRTQSVNEGGREEEDGSCRRGRKEREREETEKEVVGWLCWLVGCVVLRCVALCCGVKTGKGRGYVTE